MAREFVAFISYARKDGEDFAARLGEKLSKQEPSITLWRDRNQMIGGVDYEEQIRRAIDQVQFLILILTPAAIESKVVEMEWRYAREQGVCVCPVKAAPDAELAGLFEKLPRWMGQAHAYDLDKEWDRFVNFLKSPCQAPRVPFMADDLPSTFVERPAEFQKIREQVLDAEGKNPSGRRVALHGSGGFGKTTLALSVCHDGDVIAGCDGGVLWATLGEQPSILAELTKVYAALTGQRPQFVDADDAAIELSRKLAGIRCLLVIDDVWNSEHLKPFLRGGEQSTRLITTRSAAIAAEFADLPGRINVGELRPAEAERLLASHLPVPAAGMAPFRELAQRLGEWPILLELANRALVEQVSLGETVEGALQWVGLALGKRGIVAFDREDSTARRQAIARTVEVSLSLLKDNRPRCLELAIFPEDADVPLAVAGLLWDRDEFETRRLAQRISELSLAKLNLPGRSLRLHDAMRAYFLTQLEAPAPLHGKLADHWKDPARLAGDYAFRYAAYHVAEAMAAPDQSYDRGLQLLRLLDDSRFRGFQARQGDLAAVNRFLDRALGHGAKSRHPQAPAMVAALAVAAGAYTVESQPGRIFEQARQGNLAAAADRLDLFDAEPEWKTAARLTIAWLGAGTKPADARALVESAAASCTLPELQGLLAWVRLAPDGVPPGIGEIHGEPDLRFVSAILERAGGGEGVGEGLEPLDPHLLASGIGPNASGFIAEADGPPLVAFARLDPASHTRYLQRYIAIHAANRYRYYRNRSLWALLKAVLLYPEAEWVRQIVEELVLSALTVAPVDFREALPLTVHALRARAGSAEAAARLEVYQQRMRDEVAGLSPLRGRSDSWSHFQRRACALAEVQAAVFGRVDQAAAWLHMARDLPKGFAGFRACSCLTLAEATALARPGEVAWIGEALHEARLASHRIQDHPFCLQATAIVNAMHSRWWPASGIDVEWVVPRFVENPQAPEFSIVHLVGESFRYRAHDYHTLPIPPQVLTARTLRDVASVFRRAPEALLEVNQGNGWDLDTPLAAGVEVNVPDAEFVPLLAARFAAAVLASPGLSPPRRAELIQSLVPLAAPSATALDTVLSRLLLSAAPTPLAFPSALLQLDLSWSAPEATASEKMIA